MRHTATKLKAIFSILLFIILIKNSFAFNFTLQSPEKVKQLEKFSVTINSQGTSNATYDVKIYVHDDVKKDSEIFYDSAWKSPFNYLKRVFPEIQNFKIRANYTGETKICAKLRNSDKPSEVFGVCNAIIVEETEIQGTGPPPEENNTTQGSNQTNKYDKEKINTTSPKEDLELLNSPKTNLENKPFRVSNEKLVLNPAEKINQTENFPSANTISTKQENLRLGIIYGFTIFCVVVIIFLALRKL